MSTNHENNGSNLDALSIEALEAELKQFEIEERKRLGLPVEGAKHWFDEVPRTFTRDQREHTTILVSGLTMAHDLFIQSALRGIGYKVLAMDVPDNDALQYGREYGNRGQCNPTYFTVGNLVKYLDIPRSRRPSRYLTRFPTVKYVGLHWPRLPYSRPYRRASLSGTSIASTL